jgi:hypothetical protein
MKRRVFSKTTPFHTFKKKEKKKERAERCRFERHCSSFFFPPEHAAGKKEKGKLLFEFFCRPLSRLEPTDRTQWPTTHRALARKPGRGAEPWQSRPMADRPAAPHESSTKPLTWLYK